MQGTLSLPQRVSLRSLFKEIQSHRTYCLRSVGFLSGPRWQAREANEPRATNSSAQSVRPRTRLGQLNNLTLEGPVTRRGLTSIGNTGGIRMSGCSIAPTSSCPYRTDVIHTVVPGISCNYSQKLSFATARPVQHRTGLQWPSLQSQRGYTRKPFIPVTSGKGEQGLLLEEDGVGFKRIVSEDDVITTFYSSDNSSASQGDEVVEDMVGRAKTQKKFKAADAEDSNSETDDYKEKEKDHKKSKKLKALGKIEVGKSEKEDVGRSEEGVNSGGANEEEDLLAETLEAAEEDFEDEIAAKDEIAEVIEGELEDLGDDDDFWDEGEEGVVVAGDGGYGGGVVLGGTEWGQKALDLAEQVVAESGNDLSLFAFKVSPDGVVRVRLDKLSDRYGSPTMSDIERFSKRFRRVLEESGEAGTVPEDFEVEVSSPGAERVVRVPEDLERFKELPMYVEYLEGGTGPGMDHNQDVAEKDRILELESLDMDAGVSTWKLANVKLNREVKGKGRPLNSKQKKWRAEVPIAALKQVRLYLDV